MTTSTVTTGSSPSTHVVGSVVATAPDGQTLVFGDDYYEFANNSTDVWTVTGRGVVGPGAIGDDPMYLEGGSAELNHYGEAFDIQGRTVNICAALGLPS